MASGGQPRRNDIDGAAFRPPPRRAGAEGIGRTVGRSGRLGRRVLGAGGGRKCEDTGEDERAGPRDPAPPDGPEPREDRTEEHGRRGRDRRDGRQVAHLNLVHRGIRNHPARVSGRSGDAGDGDLRTLPLLDFAVDPGGQRVRDFAREEGEGQRPVPRRADVDIGRTGRGRLGLDAGLESLKCGWGGDRRIATLLGIDPSTVATGRRQLVDRDVEVDRVRRAGGGRTPTEKKHRKSSPASKP